MSLRKERRKKRIRGKGSVLKEIQAAQEALRRETKGDEPPKEVKPQEPPKSDQHFSPKFAGLETPYFVVNNVRYLEICGLCDSPITRQGKCMNLECLQEWGDPQKLTDELVSEMIEKAKVFFRS
ncbi:MAG: hypothetical protein Q8P55_02180 [bacterium]|nr:hypothetical protein [bacterium]